MRFRHEMAPGNGRFFMVRPAAPAALAGILLAAFLFGCSSADPEIMQADLRIVATWNPATDTITEELFLLADIFDPDGIEDVGEIRLAHDGEKLQWRAPADTVPRRSRNGQDWFSLSAAGVIGAGGVPRGTYRIDVDDLALRGAVRRVSLPLNVSYTRRGDVPVFDATGIVMPSGADTLIIAHVPDDAAVQFYQISGDASGTMRVPLNELPESLRGVVTPEARSADNGSVWLIHEVSPNLIRRSGPWR
ncbi:MAG: hypothetical protein PF508_04855 [Spirochaeta sp.]|jgi:hypothetical protein|nr:hypothetical protein [Spirochaeta sp.]